MEELIIPEITIPLGRVPANKLGRKEDYYKIIHDTYTQRYLEALGVGVTAKNRLVVARNAPLVNCEIEAAWGDYGSAIAEQLRVVQPPLTTKESLEQETPRPLGTEADDLCPSAIRGHFKYVSAVPPAVPDVWEAPPAKEGPDRADLIAAALHHMKQRDAETSEGNNAKLTGELERMRSRFRDADDRAGAAHHAGLDKENLKKEHYLRMEQELAVLKPQFILPFACMRPPAAGSGAESTIVPWQSAELVEKPEGHVPEKFHAEALEPIIATETDIHKAAASFATHRCPLELLTTRRDQEFLATVRKHIASNEVVRVTGLMAHLLYWTVFGYLHPAAQRLPETSKQSLLVSIHDRWSAVVAMSRNLPTGASFVLPIIVLTIKRGVRDVFAGRFPNLCAPGALLSRHLADQINVLFMQLFDPDCTYARFGVLDQTREAVHLWRKMDLAMTATGRGAATRMLTRKNRTTPILNTLMGLEGSRPGDAKTRRLLASSASDPVLSSSTASSGRSRPPSAGRPETEAWNQDSANRGRRMRPTSAGKQMEAWKQAAFYKVVCKRMTSSGREALSRASSAERGNIEQPRSLNEVPTATRPPRLPSSRQRSSSMGSRTASATSLPRPISASARASKRIAGA